jgi:hypothetical protein
MPTMCQFCDYTCYNCSDFKICTSCNDNVTHRYLNKSSCPAPGTSTTTKPSQSYVHPLWLHVWTAPTRLTALVALKVTT